VAITKIVFIDQAASCLGGTLTLLCGHAVRLLQAAVLATAVRRGLVHARHGLRVPLEGDPADGDLGAVHGNGLPQGLLEASLGQAVGEADAALDIPVCPATMPMASSISKPFCMIHLSILCPLTINAPGFCLSS